MEIGLQIRQLRTQRHLSQEGLAAALGLSRQAVAKWENGAALPSTANLLALCEVLDVPMSELTGRAADASDGTRQMGCPLVCGVLIGVSAVLILLSAAALLANRMTALPKGVIGYADAPTRLFVHGAPAALYLLIGVTAAFSALTAFVLLRERRKYRKKR